MNRRLLALIALIGFALSAASPAAAQQASAGLAARADALPGLFRGEVPPADLFTPAFLEQVPAAQVIAIFEQLRVQYGAAQRLNRLEARSAAGGAAFIDFERATLRFNLAVEPQAPHRITGLLLTGVEVRGDSFGRLAEELGALPGLASLSVARLETAAPPTFLAGHGADRPMAIGSTFKLFILAELTRSIRAGERRWSDVVTLDRRSLPSGIMQDWPLGAPVTLHTLAALMISRSDNSATDLLLHVVGRENVERLLPTLGVRAADRNRPFLSTVEMFALKAAPEPLLQSWLAGNEAQRRQILSRDLAMTGPEAIDLAALTPTPNRIDSLEWFASAEDLVRTLDWLRRHGDDQSRAILAISPGVDPATAGDFDYVGYKGGSEPGVINMTYLVRSRSGEWHAASGSWNNPAAPVDEARFAAVMQRALRLLLSPSPPAP